MKSTAINGSTSIVLILLLLCGFILQLAQCQVPASSESVEEISAVTEANGDTYSDVPPFLLLGIGNRLYSLPYTWPDEPKPTDELKLLHTGSSFLHYITGITYHYEKRLVFWSNSGGQISTGTFADRNTLTNVRTEQVLTGGTFFKPKVVGDVAVDWLNDKLYWTDRDGKIEERDLNTNERRTILDSSDTETAAAFNGLAMYPFPNFGGWVYWTDTAQEKIERIAVTGLANTREIIREDLGSCIWPMEIDYAEQSVYWVNTCTSNLRSLQFGSDTDQSEDRVEIDSTFSSTTSMTLFKDILYWNEGGVLKATNKSIELGEVINIYEIPAESIAFSIAVEVVHPNKQPTEEEFLKIILENINMNMLNETCPPCVNGECIPREMRCECHTGWTGENCTTDIDECELNTSRCDQECHNTLGGYNCSCNASFYLDSDGSTCIEIIPTSTIEPSVSSTEIGHEESSTGAFSISASSSLIPHEVSPTPQPSSYTLSSSSAVLSSSPLHSAVPSSSPVPISSTYVTQSSLTPSQMPTRPQETTTPTDHSPRETEPSSNDMTLIVIVAAAGGSCALLIIIVIIMIIAVVHYATKRCGSYTVNPDPSKESGTPSWIVNHSGSSKSHVNGLSGLSHQTKSSFKANSPTSSSDSYT